MSEYIGHVIIAQDALRIATVWDAVSRTLVDAAQVEQDAYWLGSATSGGNRAIRPLADELRDRTPFSDEDRVKAAFLAGWVTHQGADGYLKQVYRKIIPEYHALEDHDKTPPSDARITHDVLMLRERAGGGASAPFSRSLLDYRLESHPASSVVDVPLVEAVLGTDMQVGLLDLMSPEARRADAPLGERLDSFFRNLDPIYISTSRYAAAATKPDLEHLRRFVYDVRFYDASDTILRIANGDDGDVAEAMAETEERGCIYSRVLALTVTFLQVVGEVIDRSADLDALEPILNVQPGRAGVPTVVSNASL